MKNIPRKYPTAFFKQGMYGLPTVSYFQTCGIFLHFWGLFEWVLSNVIWSNKSSIIENLDRKSKATENEKDKEEIERIEGILNECNSALDVLNSHRLTQRRKLEILKEFNREIQMSVRSCVELRNNIAHGYVTFVGVNIGAYQEMWGYIKGNRFDKRATGEWKKTMNRARKSNPSITDEEINMRVWVTYTEQDIINEIEKLIQAIGGLGYNIETDNIYLKLRKDGFIQ